MRNGLGIDDEHIKDIYKINYMTDDKLNEFINSQIPFYNVEPKQQQQVVRGRVRRRVRGRWRGRGRVRGRGGR